VPFSGFSKTGALGSVVSFSVLRRPLRGEIDRGSSVWRRALPLGITAIVLPVLGLAIILTLVKVIAQSDYWDLPDGRLLETILSSCQFEHTNKAGIEAEHMICPTRLGTGEFPKVLKDAVIASEDERFFSHRAIDFLSTARAVALVAW
jgi:membrane peptidoglycan carboxypeptidase